MQYYVLFNMFLVVVGCFLPWTQPGLFVVGLRGIDMKDGKIIVALALIGFATISYHLLKKQERFYGLYGAIGLAVLVVTGMDLYIFYMNRYPMGPGIYVSAVGGLQLAGSYIVWIITKGRRSPPPV